jgi:hypothetical protein
MVRFTIVFINIAKALLSNWRCLVRSASLSSTKNMTIISLIIALELSLVANAFQVQSDIHIGQGNFVHGCAKALAAEVECNRYTWSLGQYSYIGWVGDARLADAMCTATCSDSLRSWNETVAKECAKDRNRSDPYPLDDLITQVNDIRQMWNATCIKDSKSGYYCLGWY